MWCLSENNNKLVSTIQRFSSRKEVVRKKEKRKEVVDEQAQRTGSIWSSKALALIRNGPSSSYRRGNFKSPMTTKKIILYLKCCCKLFRILSYLMEWIFHEQWFVLHFLSIPEKMLCSIYHLLEKTLLR